MQPVLVRTPRAALAGLVGACVPTALLYTDGFWNLQLAVVLGAVSGVAGWLLYRHRETMRERSGWPQPAFAVVVAGVPLFGMHGDLGIAPDLRIALWWLFFSSGIALWGIGCEMGAARSSGRGGE